MSLFTGGNITKSFRKVHSAAARGLHLMYKVRVFSTAMTQRNFDPGFTRRYDGALTRVIRKDGSFNVHRIGTALRDIHLFQFLVGLRWTPFLAIILAGYILANCLFAGVYLLIGVDHLQGADTSTAWSVFLSAFFFSTHTFTTVGYGTIAPTGTAANLVASLEAMIGFMSFAIATGLLYGRFSTATARLTFSDNIIVAPHKESRALMLRVANRRRNVLMELEARLLLMTVVKERHGLVRKYDLLSLEVPSVYFLPLTWTLVHPIGPGSPLHGKTAEDLARLQAEVLVLVKGYDDSFRQVVYARRSYRHDEFIWGARFVPAFHITEGGDMVLDLSRVNALEAVPPPEG